MERRDEVVVVRTGTANMASVCAALGRLKVRAAVSESPKEIAGAARLVLPGVGTLDSAMRRLRELGLTEILRRRILTGEPTLAICLGMQLLCEGSEESPGVSGLGLIGGTVGAFDGDVRVPQLGWNNVVAAGGGRLLESGYFYFANSYRLKSPVPGWSAAMCEHGEPFVAALERGKILACQFHPELSGEKGLGLISRWLKQGDGGVAC